MLEMRGEGETGVAIGSPEPPAIRGLRFSKVFSSPSRSPYDEVDWERRAVAITSDAGGVVFEQRGVEVPRSWSQTAATIVAHKYFHGRAGTPERESSVRQLVSRVVDTITAWGDAGGTFASSADRDVFRDELAAMLLGQVASFNSPVWFNVGVEERPQGSACFILSCGDSMGEILDLAKAEAMLFKFGSGTGTNLSRLRGSHEGLSAGGIASGPVSFMKGFDSFAGAIRSGGKTRRAAKMVILDVDHPDIVDFVQAKAKEERKAWALIDAGYDGSFDGEAYASVFHQNANHSVRLSDEFLSAVEAHGEWWTKEVVSGLPHRRHQARELLATIAEAAWTCGDPGVQYDTTIQRWNPVKSSGRIRASNPCSEFVFLDDTACNLASRAPRGIGSSAARGWQTRGRRNPALRLLQTFAYHGIMKSEITATEAGRRFSDLLNRVRYRRERFIVVRGGEAVAEIGPPSGASTCTLTQLRAMLDSLPVPDDAFSTDLERLRAAQPPLPSASWRS